MRGLWTHPAECILSLTRNLEEAVVNVQRQIAKVKKMKEWKIRLVGLFKARPTRARHCAPASYAKLLKNALTEMDLPIPKTWTQAAPENNGRSRSPRHDLPEVGHIGLAAVPRPPDVNHSPNRIHPDKLR